MFALGCVGFVAAGCAGAGFAALDQPPRIVPADVEIAQYLPYVDIEPAMARYYAAPPASVARAAVRNDIITERMYLIDLQYTNYETKLLRDGSLMDFGTKVTEGTLTTISALLPAGTAARALAGTATLVNGVDTAYADKILRDQIIQNVMASMRTARHDQAAVIYANMACTSTQYPLGEALSDLETYYRAGTFQTGLMRLMQTVSKAETDANADQDAAKPGSSPASVATVSANAELAAAKANATFQVAAAAKTTCPQLSNQISSPAPAKQ